MPREVRLRVDEELHYALHHFAKQYHVSASHIIRYATRDYLIRKGVIKRNGND